MSGDETLRREFDSTVKTFTLQIRQRQEKKERDGRFRTGFELERRSWSDVTVSHQCLPGEDLQQGDEVVSISQVLVQVRDVSLGLRRKKGDIL